MYLVDIIWEIIKWIWENRDKSFTFAAFTSLLLILIDKFGRKLITNQLKRLFHVRESSEFATYTKNQARIESKVDLLLQERGLVWVADSQTGKTAQNVTSGVQKRSLLQQVVYVPVTIARYFTRSKETYHSLQRRMSMKSKLLSRKFLMAVISAGLVIANDGLDLGLDQNTIVAFGSIVVAWIIGETAVDATRKKSEVSLYDAKSLDSVRSDSEDIGHTASN